MNEWWRTRASTANKDLKFVGTDPDICISAWPTIMGSFWRGLRTGFLPKTGGLRDGTAKNTGTLLRMLPLVFRELSRALLRFSTVVVGLLVHNSFHFWGHHGFFIKNLPRSVISGLSSDHQPYFWPSRGNGLAAPKIKLRFWRNGKLFLKARKKLRGEFWGVLSVFLAFPPSKTRIFGLVLSSEGSEIISHNTWLV